MKHLGDITGINGKRAPVVDVVIGGSPCQDLSVSGNRAGLGGARSSLFLEQIRIIREMREEDARRGTDDVRPRYMVWENVPGALSSGKGNDFRRILEETARVADEAAVIPGPADGKWRSWETGGALRGVYSTHSFGECPSVAVESRLSQILEDTPHRKYYLSARACKGILNRAERRGKALPEELYRALMQQSQE